MEGPVNKSMHVQYTACGTVNSRCNIHIVRTLHEERSLQFDWYVVEFGIH